MGFPKTLKQHLTWEKTPDCRCPHRWKSLGRLYGVSMGMGWVRLEDVPDCPHHGVKAAEPR